MTEKYYIYEIQAFAYSDFEHHILLHKLKFTKEQFREIIDKARERTKPKVDSFGLPTYVAYPDEFIKVLKNDFGFIDSNHMVAFVGCGYKDVCEVEYD